ncbi:MAG: SpoIID/LytB domain-containing protein [Bacteroidales bacterium]|jgi:stage II sporulation protein D|nr:SpoIID/LytB domain-containing protein [Bacteroidales bacterium]
MKIKTSIVILFLSLLPTILLSQRVNIRIFSDKQIKNVQLLPSFGKYLLVTNDKDTLFLQKNSRLDFKSKAKKIEASINDSVIGMFNKINFVSSGLKCFFQINTTAKTADKNNITEQDLAEAEKNKIIRRYDGDLIILPNGEELMLINNVDADSYIAAVVQSETWGATTNVEFFKVQALCCRNYLYSNLQKHAKNGYNLCDNVHCQVYFSRANKAEVIDGAYATKGEIVVDKEGNIIETLFHSNSGGQTVAAKDVWGKDIPYLVSVIDSFSLSSKHLNWEKTIRERQWLDYFRKKGLDVRDSTIKEELLHFNQKDGRKTNIAGIPLVEVRKDFDLRSTFFDVSPWGTDVKLSGKGYGHGVGLSQEGAIQMSENGYEYWEILEHYFPSCTVIKKTETDKLFLPKN